MERLARRDLRSLHEFLRQCYASLDLRAFPRRLISGLSRLVRCDIVAYNQLDTQRKRLSRLWEPPEADFPGSQEVFERHISEHPVIAYRIQSNDNRAFRLSDFVTQAQLHRLGVYNEFYRRLGVEHTI